jgi:hypothetical protein
LEDAFVDADVDAVNVDDEGLPLSSGLATALLLLFPEDVVVGATGLKFEVLAPRTGEVNALEKVDAGLLLSLAT